MHPHGRLADPHLIRTTCHLIQNGEQGPDVHSNGLVGRVRFLVFVGWWSFVFSIIYVSHLHLWPSIA